MTEQEIAKARRTIVTKSNELIQKSRFDLSLVQQKVVLYLISKIKPTDDELMLYDFNIAEFCQVCGIDNENGGHYAALKKAIKDIADKSIWIKLENGKETLLRWIEKPYIEPNSGIVQIKLDKDMKPYLLQLQKNFTQYELIYTIRFKSKYSIRLYELIKSIHYKELLTYERIYEMEELKKLMGADYVEWRDFRRRAFEPAIEEINAFSDKAVEYEAIKTGRFVTHIKLKIQSKSWFEANSGQEVL